MLNDEEFRELVMGALTRGVPLHEEIDVVELTHAIWKCINEDARDLRSDHFIHYGILSVLFVRDHNDDQIAQINVGPDRIIFLIPEEVILGLQESTHLRRNVGWCAMHTLHSFGQYIAENHPDLIPGAK